MNPAKTTLLRQEGMIKLGRDICYINWLASRLFGPSTLHFKANPLEAALMIESWNELWTPECHPKEIIHKNCSFLKRQSRWSIITPPHPPPKKTQQLKRLAKLGVVLPRGKLPRRPKALRIIERLDVHIRQLGKTITWEGMVPVWWYTKPYRCFPSMVGKLPQNGWFPIMQNNPY